MPVAELHELVRKYYPEADLSMVERAYAFADRAHEGQLRESGEPYITHPLGVAMILAELEVDMSTLAAALLHDVVEDTSHTIEDIRNEFGSEVSILVEGVTKLGRLENRTQVEQQVENLRKMFLAMAKDIRVILIKLADRLYNMRTLKFRPPDKQRDVAQETLEIYAPLAHRLGISRIKWELEDLSLRYLKPEVYRDLVERIKTKRVQREAYIVEAKAILIENLGGMGIHAEIQGRPKNFYSIYNKMQKGARELSEIYDLIALRVLVDTVKDCYGTLGLVHTMWKPIPGRFKDYIAMPKSNMYQSLHTTVIGPQGEPLEIQIRTREMHRTSEYGIAAHWQYKDGGRIDREMTQRLTWLRQLLEWQTDLKDAGEFMENLKIDVFADRAFVFTPKGDVADLPAGSVPIDFAYRIHSDVGHRCVGAKVNGKIVPLDTVLQNGDIVEIITSKQVNGPSRDWLGFVKTSEARNRIKQWFRRASREDNIVKGRELLEKEVRKLGIEPKEILRPEWLAELAKKQNFVHEDDLYAAVGHGELPITNVISRLQEFLKKEQKAKQTDEEILQELKPPAKAVKDGQAIRVKGVDDLLVRLARCCNPLPGDEITGYVTRGRGVTVHRVDCANIHASQSDMERQIEVTWDADPQATYLAKIEIQAMNRAGILNEIMLAISDTRAAIHGVNAKLNKDRTATMGLTFEIRNIEHMEYVMNRIRKMRDVYEVHRVVPNTIT